MSDTKNWVAEFNARLGERIDDPDTNIGGYKHREDKGKGQQGARIAMSDRSVRPCKTSRPAGR